ncbi:MAG: HlyD family efflux transporter periplasmic adaptor subunit [Pseudomonadota bacterium]|nr:HlyD family efflux transporter periplasmic adaptor subunit [Pseudomonadota bacterium]
MRRFPIKLFVIGLAIFGGGIGGFISLTKSKPVAAVREVPATSWRISAERIDLETVAPVFNGFGTIENPDTQTIKARIATDVSKLLVREGDRVRTNDVLIELDSVDAEIQLSQAKANLADAKANLISLNVTEAKNLEALTLDQQALDILDSKLSRVQGLKRRNLASEQDLDTAKQAVVSQKLQINRRELALATVESKRTQLRTAIQRFEAEVRAANRDFESTAVKAPADGQIIEVNVVAGDRVQSSQNLIVFAPDSGREVRVQVPATVAQTLTHALMNSMPIKASKDRNHPLTLTRVSGSVRDNTGSIDAFFTSTGPLPPTGTVISVSIQLIAESDVVVLPTDALYGGNLIYRVTETSTLEAITVERLGQRPGTEKTEVLVRAPNLAVGDQILVSRLPAAVTGLQVEVIQ